MQTRRLPLFFLTLGAFACTALAADVQVEFDTTGGDTWTFDKHIEGRVDRSVCDAVTIEGAAGSTVATIHDNRFWASVPLHSGENEIRARCQRQNREIARSSTQRWLARIDDRPRAWIRTRVDGRNILMDAGGSQLAAGVAAPIARYEWRARPGNVAPLISTSGTLLDATPTTAPTLRIEPPDRDGEYFVTLRVTDVRSRAISIGRT